MDWITLAIELIGLGIFIIFCVIPLREFTQILRKLRKRDAQPPLPPSANSID